MNLSKVIATVFGIGYIGKGGGTVAAVLTCALWYLCYDKLHFSALAGLMIAVSVTAVGILAANNLEIIWGKDSSKIVIDEAAGMCISLLFIPLNVWFFIAALVLFRFFDIVKPLYIRRTEKLKGGLGVMMDDVVSGIYTNIILQIALIGLK
jgi:phosphatidylglycerophosphatase A